MPALRVMGFDGVIPRTSSTMLAVNQAQVANNVKLYSQELRQWKGQTLTYSPPGGLPASIQTIYRLFNGTSSIWLTWAAVVDAVPGPIADTTESRLYYTGQATPRKTNWALANAATPFPSAYYEMGVPAPTGAPTCTPSSSVAPIETRAYVYTYLNTFGSVVEESAPSPASALVSLDAGASVVVNGFTAPPAGNYNFTGRNIYRAVTGATTATYEFVAFIPLATTTYTDTLTVAQLGGVLPTLGWLPPPAGLLGLKGMSCGSLVGFVGNTVWFSQPFFPHAWPIAYSISLPYQIVGLAVMDNSVVMMTTKFPYILSGALPGSMSPQLLPLAQPCLSKASIVSNELGVLYAGTDGMVSIGSGGAAIITDALYKRDEWQAINPASMCGVSYDEKYFGVFLSPFASQTAIVLDAKDTPALSNLSLNAQAVFSDTQTGNFYIVSAADNNIYQVDADALHPLAFTWTSKRFVNAQSVAMSALKVDADYTQISANAAYNAAVAAIVASNTTAFASASLGALNTRQVNSFKVDAGTQVAIPVLASTAYLQLAIYGDLNLICTVPLASYDPIRLPPFRAREIYFSITGSIPVRSVEMATSVRDLDPKAWSDSATTPALFT